MRRLRNAPRPGTSGEVAFPRKERSMRMLIRTVATTLVLGLSTVAIPAHAFDLTGHWTGKWSCKGFAAPFNDDNGKLVNKYSTGNSESTLAITQTGSTFAATIDAGNGNYMYNGFAMANAKDAHKGEVVLLGCSTRNTLTGSDAEILRAAVSTKDGTFKASFKGASIFADDFPEVETCKYSYKRLDTVDPQLDACP
jgi:hypothetical protein